MIAYQLRSPHGTRHTLQPADDAQPVTLAEAQELADDLTAGDLDGGRWTISLDPDAAGVQQPG